MVIMDRLKTILLTPFYFIILIIAGLIIIYYEEVEYQKNKNKQ